MQGYDREGYNENDRARDGYDREGYDREGYDEDGYDSEGYDRGGYDVHGYNRFGRDRKGYDSDGYDMDGQDIDGNSKTPEKDDSKVTIKVAVVKNPDSNQLIVINTEGRVIVNNAYGRDAMAEAWAKLNLGLAKTMPNLLAGKAVVVEKQD
jgi:hypothetical protein